MAARLLSTYVKGERIRIRPMAGGDIFGIPQTAWEATRGVVQVIGLSNDRLLMVRFFTRDGRPGNSYVLTPDMIVEEEPAIVLTEDGKELAAS